LDGWVFITKASVTALELECISSSKARAACPGVGHFLTSLIPQESLANAKVSARHAALLVENGF